MIPSELFAKFDNKGQGQTKDKGTWYIELENKK